MKTIRWLGVISIVAFALPAEVAQSQPAARPAARPAAKDPGAKPAPRTAAKPGAATPAPRPAAGANPGAPGATPGAPGGTPGAGAGAGTPLPGGGAGLRKDTKSYSVKLRGLSERIASLKELVSQTKIRLNLLKEAVLGQQTAGSELTIIQDNKMGNQFRMQSYRYFLDGKRLAAKQKLTGKASEKGVTKLYSGPAGSGVHLLTVEIWFRGHGFGVFSYLRGYRYRVRAKYRFKIVEGTGTKVMVVPYEKGSAFTAMKDRPAIKFSKRSNTLTLKRGPKGAQPPKPAKTSP